MWIAESSLVLTLNTLALMCYPGLTDEATAGKGLVHLICMSEMNSNQEEQS